MLEFIVLGKVPGTHFNITYSWVLALAAGLLIMLEIRYHRNYALKVQAATASASLKTPAKSAATRRTTKKKPTASKSTKTTRKTTTRKSTTTTRK